MAKKELYGNPDLAALNQPTIELLYFLKGGSEFVPRHEHMKNAIRLLYPDFEFNPWSNRRFKAFCEYDFISLAGCAASGKTHDAALFAWIWWIAAPDQSTVVLTSTTKQMIRQRSWPVLQKLYGKHEFHFTNRTEFDTTIRYVDTEKPKQRDDLHAIFAKAVADGETSKAVDNIQGLHPERMLLIIDEATSTPQAIFDVIPNLMASTKEFKVIVIGNPTSYFDPHGRFSQPANGWESVTLEDEEWETVTQRNGKPGICLRFDALKSPNWLAQENKYPYLVRTEVIKAQIETAGEADPLFWKYYRGFWAPDGLTLSVFSMPLLLRHGCMSPGVPFVGRHEVYAGLDPAWTGDKCILRFAKVGENMNGRIQILLDEVVEIKIDATKKDSPRTHQIVEKVIAECKAKNVRPENFGLDATAGGGGALADMFNGEWSHSVKRVQFGGPPSDRPISEEDPRPAKDIYDRKVTELWFVAAAFAEADALFNLDVETANQLCSRLYEEKGRKTYLESKKEFSKRYGRSPDEADALAVLIDVVRTNFGDAEKRHSGGVSSWNRAVAEYNGDAEPEYASDYSVEEDFEVGYSV